MWVRFLGWEGNLWKEMATHFSILAREIPWREKPGRLQSIGLQGSDMTEYACMHTYSFYKKSIYKQKQVRG